MANLFSAKARATTGAILILFLLSASFLLFAFSHTAVAETGDYIVVRVDDSISKVCQLVGDSDIERNESTTSLTYTR